MDAAHAQGLKSIRTTLLQAPTDENGQTAICVAEIELVAGKETKVFSGIGDASPKNVNRNIANHVIRMAETRAKARALRDAINVGMTALEELEGTDLAPEEPGPRKTLTLVPRESKAAAGAAKNLASKTQIDQVTQEMKRTGFTADEGRAYLQERFGKSSRLELTRDEIEQFLAHLQGLPARAVGD